MSNKASLQGVMRAFWKGYLWGDNIDWDLAAQHKHRHTSTAPHNTVHSTVYRWKIHTGVARTHSRACAARRSMGTHRAAGPDGVKLKVDSLHLFLLYISKIINSTIVVVIFVFLGCFPSCLIWRGHLERKPLGFEESNDLEFLSQFVCGGRLEVRLD